MRFILQIFAIYLNSQNLILGKNFSVFSNTKAASIRSRKYSSFCRVLPLSILAKSSPEATVEQKYQMMLSITLPLNLIFQRGPCVSIPQAKVYTHRLWSILSDRTILTDNIQ